MTLAIGYAHSDLLTAEFHHSMMRLKDAMDFRTLALESGPNMARARSEIAAAFLTMEDCDHLLFVDTDMRFDVHNVDQLLRAKVPIVSALMHGQHKTSSQEVFFIGHRWKEPGIMLRRVTRQDLFDHEHVLLPVAAVGTGFTLIQRRVLEGLAPIRPYDPFGHVVLPSGQAGGEDVAFSLKAAEAGFQPYIHTACGVGHVKKRVI